MNLLPRLTAGRAILVTLGLTTGQVIGMYPVSSSLTCTAGVEATTNNYATAGAMPPPTSGPFIYGDLPGSTPATLWLTSTLAVGASYDDPTFGSTITRLTAGGLAASNSDIYVKRWWWNLDETMIHYRRADGEADGGAVILRISDQAIMCGPGSGATQVPVGGDISWDPANADQLFFFDYAAAQIRIYTVSTCTRSTLKDFSATLQLTPLGGGSSWISNDGQIMGIELDGAARIYNRQTDTLYSGAVTGTSADVAITPDGNWLVRCGGANCDSYAINHGTETLSTTANRLFSCGGHNDIGRGVRVGEESEATGEPTINAATVDEDRLAMDCNQQKADTVTLVQVSSVDANHSSCAGFAPICSVSVESTDDDGTIALTKGFQQEMLLVNYEALWVRRLFHHRSRFYDDDYQEQPHHSLSPSGRRLLFHTNMGAPTNLYRDLYWVQVCTGGTEPRPIAIPTPDVLRTGRNMVEYFMRFLPGSSMRSVRR